jgi:hypothetical protein
MANDNRIDQIVPLPGFPTLVKNVPPNYPQDPSEGKISLLWEYNKTEIWHKFSPYTDRELFFGSLSNKQPFVYRYPDEEGKTVAGQLPTQYKSFESRVLPLSSTLDDLVRVAKFSASPVGALFYIKQFGLQALQPFPETRIYNPLSPILSTINPMTFGLINRPTRQLELSLTGLASAVGLNYSNDYSAPPSTVGPDALATFQGGTGRGLLRSPTSGKAYSTLQAKWPVTVTKPGSGISGQFTTMANAAKSFFASVIPKPSPEAFYRADENAYQLMLNSARLKTAVTQDGQDLIPQMWYNLEPTPVESRNLIANAVNASSNVSNAAIAGATLNFSGLSNALAAFGSPKRARQGSIQRSKMFSYPSGFRYIKVDGELKGKSVESKTTGYAIEVGFYRYSDYVKINRQGEPYENSDMIVQYSEYYANTKDGGLGYPSRMSDPKSFEVDQINQNLKRVINSITNAGYKVNPAPDGKALSNPQATLLGYDKILLSARDGQTYERSYSTKTKTLVSQFDAFSFRFAGKNKSDGLNRVSVLRKDRKIPKELQIEFSSWKQYKPYEDDLIAFYFYDVVNERYIPFRATVKGIAENGNAVWEELRFIGRPDQLYSYSGFTRTLSFTFNVVVNTIKELLPTWKKINYMMTAVKPANYTNSETGINFNRVMVPPMFMLTIGDLYTYQPIILKSVSMNIPEDAAWETLNQHNNLTDWNYLNRVISDPSIGKRYAQLPREVEMIISCDLLEKERPIVGSANFGHAPHTQEYVDGQYVESTEEFLPRPSDFHKGMVEYHETPWDSSISTWVDGSSRPAAAGQTSIPTDGNTNNTD